LRARAAAFLASLVGGRVGAGARIVGWPAAVGRSGTLARLTDHGWADEREASTAARLKKAAAPSLPGARVRRSARSSRALSWHGQFLLKGGRRRRPLLRRSGAWGRLSAAPCGKSAQ